MKSERACCLTLFGKRWEYRKDWEEEAAFTIHQVLSSATPTVCRYLWVFVRPRVADKHRGGCQIRGAGWKRAHPPHSRGGTLPTNNMGHRLPGQTVAWQSCRDAGAKVTKEERLLPHPRQEHFGARYKRNVAAPPPPPVPIPLWLEM